MRRAAPAARHLPCPWRPSSRALVHAWRFEGSLSAPRTRRPRGRGWNLHIGYIRDATLGWLDQLEAMAAQGRNILFVPRIGHARAAAESAFGLLNPARRRFHATGLVLSAGQAVYIEDSKAVWSIWESGHVRFSHQIKR